MKTVDPLTFSYSLRHLLLRKTQVMLTVGGIALVVFVFVATLMLAAGLSETLSSTGSPDNVIVLRNGATNEIQSGISREHGAVVLSDPSVARDAGGQPEATSEILVLVSLNKRSDGQRSNVNLRGTAPKARAIRPGISIIEGSAPRSGTREVMIGTAIREKFAGTTVGSTLRLVGTDWLITGIFDAGNSAFSSEIWGDVDVMMPSFRRERFSSVTFRLAAGADFEAVRERLQNDRRLSVSIYREQAFYESQSRSLSIFIGIIGGVISAVFSLGAIIGAMITMYSSVANRVREIGILRALGFSRKAIFLAFVRECLLVGFVGGVLGVIAAMGLGAVRFATTNFSTFSEVAFGFTMTPRIALFGVLFALAMGLIGGALPAWRASRLQIVEELRSR